MKKTGQWRGMLTAGAAYGLGFSLMVVVLRANLFGRLVAPFFAWLAYVDLLYMMALGLVFMTVVTILPGFVGAWGLAVVFQHPNKAKFALGAALHFVFSTGVLILPFALLMWLLGIAIDLDPMPGFGFNFLDLVWGALFGGLVGYFAWRKSQPTPVMRHTVLAAGLGFGLGGLLTGAMQTLVLGIYPPQALVQFFVFGLCGGGGLGWAFAERIWVEVSAN